MELVMKCNKALYFIGILFSFIFLYYLLINGNIARFIFHINLRSRPLYTIPLNGKIIKIGQASKRTANTSFSLISRFILNYTIPYECSRYDSFGRSNLLQEYNFFKSDYKTPKALSLPKPICPANEKSPLAIIGVISKSDEIERRNMVLYSIFCHFWGFCN